MASSTVYTWVCPSCMSGWQSTVASGVRCACGREAQRRASYVEIPLHPPGRCT